MRNSGKLFGVLVAVSSLLCGCDDEAASRSEVTGVKGLCVETVKGADGPSLEVTAQMDVCLSSGCDKVVDSDCTVTEVDGELQVQARVVVESQGNTCAADCGGASVTCTFEPVEAQTYTVRAGSETVTFDGASGELTCTEDPL